jgi:hypothetical protein
MAGKGYLVSDSFLDHIHASTAYLEERKENNL